MRLSKDKDSTVNKTEYRSKLWVELSSLEFYIGPSCLGSSFVPCAEFYVSRVCFGPCCPHLLEINMYQIQVCFCLYGTFLSVNHSFHPF